MSDVDRLQHEAAGLLTHETSSTPVNHVQNADAGDCLLRARARATILHILSRFAQLLCHLSAENGCLWRLPRPGTLHDYGDVSFVVLLSTLVFVGSIFVFGGLDTVIADALDIQPQMETQWW